jgi:hypothetical protein
MADRERQRVQARDPDDRDAEHLGERLRGLDSDTQSREQPGPDPDRDPTHLAELDAGPSAESLQGRRDRLLASLAGHRDHAEQLALRADRHRRVGRRGLDAYDDHGAA